MTNAQKFPQATDNPIATRAQGLALLEAFGPAMGRRYADGRNFDHGPGQHTAVSTLSPYIRRRLVTEQEVVAQALALHGAQGAEKFIQEVFWRSYFKGWLERRPPVWASYRQGLAADLAALDTDTRVRRGLDHALTGRTGLACFDAWVQELVTTGYLHNHARMWFASIWIFTLRLPWRLGADFFYRHLLDGDAASNTLGWRWVAGLHTRGKPYQAQAWNIATFTGQRFTPRDKDLAAIVTSLEDQEPNGLAPLQPLRAVRAPKPGQPTALLLTDEDCRLEDFNLAALDIRASALLHASHLRSTLPVAESVVAFERAALLDAAARAGVKAKPLVAGRPEDLAEWAAAAGATQIATPYATRGPVHDWLTAATPALSARGITLCEWHRDWDRDIWPLATAGFFKVKERIPQFLKDFT